MYLRLDAHSGEPIWKQIVEQVKYKIASGQVAPGEKLPSIRALGSELKINPRTVVKAYDELGHMGLVISRQGQGAFIKDGAVRDTIPATTRKKVLTDLSRRLLSEGARMGASAEEMVKVFTEAAKEIESKQDDNAS